MLAAVVTLVLVASSFALAHAGGPCNDDTWRYSPHSNKCYKLFNEKIGWNMAEFRCAFKGAHHFSLHNSADNDFVAELARPAGVVWLGMAQFGSNPQYIWSDHTSFDYENWHAKHGRRRPAYHRGRKCAKLEGSSKTWMQSCCKVPAAFICERPASGSAALPTWVPNPPPTSTTTQRAPMVAVEDSGNAFDNTNSVTGNDLRKFRFRRLRRM